MNHLRKSLSLFLCIVMCLSFFPFFAAYAEEAENIEEAPVLVEDELVQPSLQDNNSSEDQEELPHEHSYTAVVTEPTCTEQGFTTYTCACGDSYVDDYTDALNHPEIIDVPEVPAIETEPGITAGKKCAVCGEILEGCEEVPALEEQNVIDEIQAEKDSPIIEEKNNSVSETIVEKEEVLNGASYPSLFFFSDADFKDLIVQDSVVIGNIYPVRMKWYAAYNYEGYDITIYDSNKHAVATASKTWANIDYTKNITVKWDTTDCKPGLYTVEVVKKFYSLYKWNEAPTTSTLFLQLKEAGSPATYTIRYNANGGSGAPANQTKTHGTALKLSSTKPTRADYSFLGWAESASATSPQYQPGDLYYEEREVTLYAIWWNHTSPIIFTDVSDPNAYFFNPVYWAVDNGITVGAGGEGLFSPYAPCTREQIVTFLWRLKGQPEPTEFKSFTDVPNTAWYYKPISWAAQEGITTGYADGSGRFGVGDPCTREQSVTFLWRAAGKPAPSGGNNFTDMAPGAYYIDAVSWAAENGITVGLNDGTGRFGVGGTCSRAMIVTFLYRYNDAING